MLKPRVKVYARMEFVNASGALVPPYPEMELNMARSHPEV